jgi:hypothetical protein
MLDSRLHTVGFGSNSLYRSLFAKPLYFGNQPVSVLHLPVSFALSFSARVLVSVSVLHLPALGWALEAM